MCYFVLSKDDSRRARWTAALEREGHEVVAEYRESATVVTVGGDGTILYAARQFAAPTILPVRAGDSEGYRTELETDRLVEAVGLIEGGTAGEEYAVERHHKLVAYRDGGELRGRFGALNEISLHHASPVLAAVFAVRARDGATRHEFDRVTGDGVVVATPFGSSGYYRSITGGTIASGIGVGFNNVHQPDSAPDHIVLSRDGVVEIEAVPSDHAAGAVLTRDNDDEMYELTAGESIEVRTSPHVVEIISPNWAAAGT